MDNELKLVAISDLHGILPNIENEADILLIAGDVSPLKIQGDKVKVWEWFSSEFKEWVMSLPVDKVFMIAGNHDFIEHWNEHKQYDFEQLFNGKLKYLRNETRYYTKNNVKWSIFGTPYCNIFGGWPFMRNDEYLTEKFKEIPDEVDIIITHSPPYGVGQIDCILETPIWSNHDYDNLGNKPLRNRLDNIKFKYLCCGHIHSGDKSGINFNGGVCFNVSVLNENYDLFYEPNYYKIIK